MPRRDQHGQNRIAAGTTRYADNLRIWVQIEGHRARALIDSGCTGIFMTPRFAQQLRIRLQRKARPFPLQAIDGQRVTYNHGMVDEETEELALRLGRHREQIQFDITESPGSDIILGLPWLKTANPHLNWKKGTITFPEDSTTIRLPVVHDALGTIEICAMTSDETQAAIANPKEDVQVLWVKDNGAEPAHDLEIPEEYQEYATLFEEEPEQDALPKHEEWDHSMPLLPGKQPVKQPVRPLSAEKLEILRKYLDDNLRKGFIRESQSPAGYPILFVPKGENDWRLCVDYRGLNEITVKNSYPLPLLSELQDRLQGAVWFTKFDIPGAYNRIRIKEGEEWKTAFRTRFGHYEYMVMPFGLTNAPATWQAFINNVLREHLDVFVVVYLDDILVYSRTYEEHVGHVRKVLQKLKDANLRIKPQKSEFHKQEVLFLGYVVSKDGLKMDDKKVQVVREWPTPTTVKEVQSFLGFANFYRRFIAHYSRITAPLTALTAKDVRFEWGKAQQEAFDELKQRFTDQPILLMFDPEKPITVETDASDAALGACLSQPGPSGKLQPVAYHSRKMTGPELRYDVGDKELLAIVDAYKAWRVYLEGPKHQVTVYTDHENLQRFTTTKQLVRKQIRWAEELSSFNCKIVYRKGSENARADALSRRTDYMKGVPKEHHAILKENEDGSLGINRLAATTIAWQATFHDQLRTALLTDPTAQAVRKQDPLDVEWEDEDGELLFRGLVYVPTALRTELLRLHHDIPTAGHPGEGKMNDILGKQYYFPGMRKAVEDYLRRCITCRRSKHDRHKPYGLLQPLRVPDGPWQSLSMDFIVKLPASQAPTTQEFYDGIMVIVDRFTKFAKFLPYRETFTVEDLAHVFVRDVVALHGMPRELVTDRGSLFTSNFWTALMEEFKVKHKLSTAYHPQTDGQTERMNQTLEQYLRCYVNDKQDNWVQLLPLAQFAYNSTPVESTKMSPFQMAYGFPSSDVNLPRAEGSSPAAHQRVTQMAALRKSLQADLAFYRFNMARYANRKRIEGPILKGGDKVYLLRRNIKSDKQSPKLDAVKLGPFEIKEKRGPVNFELRLPRGMRIHPVFHVSLLEPAAPDATLQTEPPPLDPEVQESTYEVERILKDRWRQGQREYLVKWKGYSDTETTWEPQEHFNSKTPILRYHQNQRPKRRPRPRKGRNQ
jgi:hypothetical protein